MSAISLRFPQACCSWHAFVCLIHTQLHQMGSGVVSDRRGLLRVGGDLRAVRACLLARRPLQERSPLPQSVAGICEFREFRIGSEVDWLDWIGLVWFPFDIQFGLILICMQAGNCADSEVIFRFLEANQIGQSHTNYYLSYASVMESKNKLKKANEIFNLGIAR